MNYDDIKTQMLSGNFRMEKADLTASEILHAYRRLPLEVFDFLVEYYSDPLVSLALTKLSPNLWTLIIYDSVLDTSDYVDVTYGQAKALRHLGVKELVLRGEQQEEK